MASKSAKDTYPIHWLVWHNDFEGLDEYLKDNQEVQVDVVDPRGRTPLHLSVTLGHLETAKVLLRHGANTAIENSRYWSVTQEAVSTGDPELLQLCLQHRDFQRFQKRTEGVPGLLEKLKEAPDFYVEMKWEFTSWVPLVSRMCPSDTYKVWKSGANVRIDTTLLGFDNMNWQRGSRSYVFKGNTNSATVMEIDHDMHQVYTETMQVMADASDPAMLAASEDSIAARITSPIVTTYIDTDKISFERNKSGIWGWRSDKTEDINDYECKVFSASNVELVTKTRVEHLTDNDKKKEKKSRTPLESFLGIAEQQEKVEGATANGEIQSISNNPCSITPEDYFDPDVDLEGKDIGRPIEQTTKTQKFKANLWLCENYPLSLPEQVVPIIDLMAASNAHFKKLKDFITLSLPVGFPVKIEIPLFHVLNARITFGNIFGSESDAPNVTCIKDAEGAPLCAVVDDSVFEAPASYSVLGDHGHGGSVRLRDEDDQLLQFAIQQSLVEPGTENDQVTFWEALNRDGKNPPSGFVNIASEEERQLQRALEESMRMTSGPGEGPAEEDSTDTPAVPAERPAPLGNPDESQLRVAMELSRRQQEEDEKRRKQEEEELEMILKLSLTEK